MTNKAYIVANEQQENEVLKKLEDKGALWGNGKNATNFIPFRTFPYVIYCSGDKYISWDELGDLDVNKIIVYDGRKEEQMSDKYVVSQEFMNKLEEWKNGLIFNDEFHFISNKEIQRLPENVQRWRNFRINTLIKSNERSIAIIRWVNGEDVFEVEKPKKWIVRSKETDYSGKYGYIEVDDFAVVLNRYNIDDATNFDTKEEAESWANSHQEVIEVNE